MRVKLLLATILLLVPRPAMSAGDPGTWEQAAPKVLNPAPRDGAGMTYDTAHERVVLFGGYGNGGWSNELWVHETNGERGWHLLDSGTGPSARSDHGMVVDPVRGRTFVYGGLNLSDYYGDLWSVEMTSEGAVWQSIDAGAGPGPRASHTMVYDPPRDRMLLFGGTGPSGRKNDLWELSLSGTPTWTLLATSGGPPSPRSDHAAVYDRLGDRMIVYGGEGASELHDTWSLALAGTPTWSSLPSPPYLFPGAVAVIDEVGNRMVLSGSRLSAGHSETEVWELGLFRSHGWSKLTPAGTAPELYNHAAVYELSQDRMFFFDNWSGFGAIAWNRPIADVDPPSVIELALHGIHPNPGSRAGTVSFTLPDGGSARLELIDVTGRRVLVREVGSLGRGHHRVALGAAHLGPGMYWVRIERAGVSLTRKAVIVR